jgi:hypothetical protein
VPLVESAQALEELDEIAATAQENVLSVIHQDAAFLVSKRENAPAQEVAGFQQGNGITLVQETDGCGNTGQSAAQHHHAGFILILAHAKGGMHGEPIELRVSIRVSGPAGEHTGTPGLDHDPELFNFAQVDPVV